MDLRDVNRRGGEADFKQIEKTPRTVESEVSSADQRDAQTLARLGKKPVLKVCNSWCKNPLRRWQTLNDS